MFNDIKVIENFLSTEECDYVLNKCKVESNLSIAGTTNDKSNNRKSSVAWINNLDYVNERLIETLKNSFNINGMEIIGLGPFQFTEYKTGEYYDWHTDRTTTTYRDRFVSTVIVLNDDYVGGVLEIKNSRGDLVPIKHKMGNLYIFDSILGHRVTVVDKGIRYSLVNWVSLIKTDSVKQNIL